MGYFLLDRFSKIYHWSTPQIRDELADSYGVILLEDAIEDYLSSYQVMVAARLKDHLKDIYKATEEVVLSYRRLATRKGT